VTVPAAARVRDRVAADFAVAPVAHDVGHLERVARLAQHIATREGAPPEAAAVAAYVHDYHRLAEHLTGGVVRPEAPWTDIARVLTDCAVPADWWPDIRDAVALTGHFGFAGDDLAGRSPVARCVHDADNLDAIGAIGIARAFMYGGAIAEPLWLPEAEQLAAYRDGPTSSVVAHFYEKLVLLSGDMLTGTGRALAAERQVFLLDFLRRFHEEWGDAASAPVRELTAGDGRGGSPSTRRSSPPRTPST
jgi:uncharacterized protein